MGNPWMGKYFVRLFDGDVIVLERKVRSKSKRLALLNVLVSHTPKDLVFNRMFVGTIHAPHFTHPKEVTK